MESNRCEPLFLFVKNAHTLELRASAICSVGVKIAVGQTARAFQTKPFDLIESCLSVSMSALMHHAGVADASGSTLLQICTKSGGDFVSGSTSLFTSPISLYRNADTSR